MSSQLSQLLEAVKDEKLPLPMLEKYRDELVHLHSAMQLELAGIEKEEALFFLKHQEDPITRIKMLWKSLPEGQRGIELNRYIKAVVKEVDSLKSRIYAQL